MTFSHEPPGIRHAAERKEWFRALGRPAENEDEPLTPGEAAAVLGISLRRLANYARRGGIPSFKTPGGHHRYRRSDVEALLRLTGRSPGKLPPAGWQQEEGT